MQVQAYLSDAAPKHHLFLPGCAAAACPPPANGYNTSNTFSVQIREEPLTAVEQLQPCPCLACWERQEKVYRARRPSPSEKKGAGSATGQSLLLIVTAKIHAQAVRTHMYSLMPAAMKHPAAVKTSMHALP